MFAVLTFVLFSSYVYFGNALHCFDCKTDKSVDIRKLTIDEIYTILGSATCTTGGYAIGSDNMISCKEDTAELNRSKRSLFHTYNGFQTIYADVFKSKFGNTQNSSNGECIWTRNHVDCSQADDDDSPTVCDCRRPKYLHGCSSGHRGKITLWILLLSSVSAFVLGKY